MYAIFESGGRQYWAQTEQVVRLDSLGLQAGDKVEFENVMVVRNDEDMQVGQPYVAGAKIAATVVEQGRGKKIRVFNYRSKKHSKKERGHRQDYTAVRIDKITV